MSETVSSGAGPSPSSGDLSKPGDERIGAYVVYGLLIVSPFTTGLTGLIGGIIAHVMKAPGLSVVQSHIRFQIKIFWIALLMMLPLVFGLLAGLTVFFMRLAEGVDVTQMTLDPWVIPAFVLAGLLAGGSWLWQLGASLYGLLKLANNEPLGRDYN